MILLFKFAIPIAVVITTTIGIAAASQPDSDAKMEDFFKQYLEEYFQMQPTAATELGDHRFDHLLDDVSRALRDQWLAHARRTLTELPQKVDYSSLSCRPDRLRDFQK